MALSSSFRAGGGGVHCVTGGRLRLGLMEALWGRAIWDFMGVG